MCAARTLNRRIEVAKLRHDFVQHDGMAASEKCGIASCGTFSMTRAGPEADRYGWGTAL
jgi:hypothetical protein